MRMILKFLSLILSLTLASACTGGKTNETVKGEPSATPAATQAPVESSKIFEEPYKGGTNPVITIQVKDFGDIVLELDAKAAPITVNNFVKLAKEGFYDGLIFHRVYKGFMIQGGDPQGTGTGGPGYGIKGEFAQNGVNNTISHTRGTISMARSQSFDSAGSQFFICDADSTFLDGQYAAFGKVTKGLDVLDAIASTPVKAGPSGEPSMPLTAPVITKITVEEK